MTLCTWDRYQNHVIIIMLFSSKATTVRVLIYILYAVKTTFLCPQRNFGRHIVIALSVRPSVCPSRFRVRSISPIFFEVGILNMVCGYILGWRSVAYHFRVTVTLTLTSDLVFRIIVSGAYILYYLRYEFQIWCVDASCDDEVSRTIIGSL